MPPFARILLATVGTALAPVAGAWAQSVDYAALQDTFGEPVTTSVTGKPQRASSAPASITIITRDEIAHSPARSVPDLLKVYAGVNVNHWTAGQSDVAIRGGVQPYNARLLVLVNGRQVYLDHYGMTDWNLLGVPLDAIQQIELVRGPASALFGFNAASGVVNIITVSPKVRQIAATAEGGNHGYSRFSGVATTAIGDNLAVRLSGGRLREDERRIPSTIGVPPKIGDVTADQVSATITVTPDAATRVELNGGYADNRQLEFLPSEVLLAQRFRNRTAGANFDRDTGWGSVSAQAYTNWLTAGYGVTGAPVGPFSQLANTELRNRVTVAKASSLVRIDSANTIRVEAEYRNNQLFSDILYSRRIGYQVAAADAMVDLHPADRIAISVAGRIDHLRLDQGGMPRTPIIDPATSFDRSIDRISFNAAIVVQVGPAGQMRLNGGRGIQSPSLVNFGFRTQLPAFVSPIPLYTTGDPRIDPATVWSVELGYAQAVTPDLRIEGNAFFTRTNNAIASPGDSPVFQIVALPAPSAVFRFGNVGAFETYGVAVTASGRLVRSIGWNANYTWTHVHEAFANAGPPFVFALAPAATTPKHVANLSLDYGGGRWFGSATARYSSSTRQLAFNQFSRLALLPVRRAVGIGAKIGYHVTAHMNAYAAGENLTDASGTAGSPVPADRRLRLGINYTL